MVLKVFGKFEGMRARKVCGKFEGKGLGMRAWKVRGGGHRKLEVMRLECAWVRGFEKFEGTVMGIECAWKVARPARGGAASTGKRGMAAQAGALSQAAGAVKNTHLRAERSRARRPRKQRFRHHDRKRARESK